MPVFKAPLRDMRFILDEVFQASDLWARLPALADQVDRDTVDAILEEAAKFNENVVFPLNRSGDEEGAKFDNGVVTTPAGFKEAFAQYGEGCWIGLGADPRWGGQGMPKMVTVMTEEIIFGVNPSFALYPLLGIGAALALCFGTAGVCEVGVTDTEIHIGQWGPQTGPAAPWGAVARGTDAEANRSGGLSSRPGST